MAGAQCCDNPPTLNPSSGSGHVDEVGGFKSYLSGSPDSKLAVLLISDVYGYEAPNLRKLADKVGAAGYFAVVPDFLHGDPFNPQNTERPIHAWIKDHGPDKAYEDAKVVIESLKHKGISKIGAAGFCWGAKVVVQLAQSDEYIQAGVFLHPSFVTVDDVKGVKVPLAVLGAETDHLSPPELVKQFEEALNAKPERLGNTSLHSPSQHPTPHISPETNYFEEQSPHVFQASNSQIEEDPEENVSETPQYPPPPLRVPTNSNQQLARVNRMWSVAEDEALIGLYLQFSEGAIVGTNQKASVLWRNVSAAYNEAQAEKPHILPPRPLKSLENRWRRMASDLLQWSAVYDEAGKITGSGYNEADRIQKASKLFFISSKPQPHNFTCFHGWEMVKNDPKWRSKLRWALSKEERLACGVDEDCESTESGKRSRTEAEGNGDGPGTGYSSGGLPRPDGVKKAKAKRNKGKATASHDVALSISEQMKVYNEERKYDRILREKKLDLDLQKEKRKQKMVELQERKMNFDMLQALLHKGAPLTASEEAWKEELIRLVYGGLNNE